MGSKIIKLLDPKKTLSKVAKKIISKVEITYFSQKSKYILKKKNRASTTCRVPTNKVKPLYFINFCATQKIKLSANLFWEKIQPTHLYIIANPWFLNFIFLTIPPKKAENRKRGFLQFANDYKSLFDHQTELALKCELFDPRDYEQIEVKHEPLEHWQQQPCIKEEPL